MRARLFSALCVLGAAALAWGLAAAVVVAQTQPGTEVVNIARVTWQVGGVQQAQILSPEARFTVSRPASPGVLQAWELDKGLTDAAPALVMFPAGDYRRNPFVPLPEPVDRSTLTGDPTPVDRRAPLRVVPASQIRLGVPVFWSLTDQGLNRDPAQVETVVVFVSDAVTGDREELRFYETGPDTGLFTGWTNTTASAASGDGQLVTQANSVITAQYRDAANGINNRAVDVLVGPIDPFGVVFDSRTGAPLSGVQVTLIDTATGAPADVFGDDLIARYPATIVTGSQVTDSAGRIYQLNPGGYRFPNVAPGTYRIVVSQTGDATHTAPSQRDDAALQMLAGAPFTLGAGARLAAFDVLPGPPLRIDIPMDPLVIATLTRSASHAAAAIGEFLEYTVTLTADEPRPLTVTDTLPAGVAYLPGTLRVDGQPVTPVLDDAGRRLVYTLADLRAGQAVTITYGAQVTPLARAGQDLRSISAVTTPGARAMQADHSLQLRDALGLDQVAILGQISGGGCGQVPVAYDLSGIRVLLENGEFAMTDSDGRFTFRDIYRRPRVVQVDVTTLPLGARPVLCHAGHRSAGSPISQFVDLQPGMMGRVEFYLEFDAAPAAQAATSDPAADVPAEVSPLVRYDSDWLDRNAAGHGAGFLAPADGYMPRSEAIDVVYLRPAGATSELAVNGEPVPGIRREPAIRASNGKWELVRYRAVRIGEGRNALTLVVTGADGKVTRRQSRDVLYGLRPAQLDLIRAASVLETDGRSHPQITLRLTDSAGIPIRPGTQVAVRVEAPFGFAPSDPVRRSQPGSSRLGQSQTTATVGTDGVIALALAPVLESGTARLTIPSADRDLALAVPISAANRPWVLVGLAEGSVAHDRIRAHMRRDGEIGNALAGRVSLFAEGVIRGEWLLTLRYDSAEQGDAFYGIDPDADYIVYGDRSVQGHAAQSRFPLYVRLRKEGAAYLIGDFNTDLNAGGVTINQTVTGARAVFEDDTYRVMVFAAQGSNRLVADRIALNGTIGPYALSRADMIANSETIRLVTVSRFDASEELSSRSLIAGVDYVVSAATGRFFLRRPIPAFTADLDRNVLVIDYEAGADQRDAVIAGIRAERSLNERMRLGATAVHARRVDGQDVSVTLAGVDLTYQASDALLLHAEVLVARRNFAAFADTGLRSEIRAEYDRETTQIAAYLRRQTGIVAPSADRQAIDTTITGLTLRHQLWAMRGDALNRWLVEGGLLAENDSAGAQRRADGEVLLTRERDLTTQSIGLRGLRNHGRNGRSDDIRLVVRGVETTSDEIYTTTAELQSSLRPDGARAADQLTLGTGYALTEEWHLFSTFELESLRNQATEARRFTFGADYTPRDGRAYRGALSMAGDTSGGGQAVFVGAEHSYQLRDRLRAHLGSDMQWDNGAAAVPMGQSIGNPYIAESFAAVRAGLRYDSEGWGSGIDAEVQHTRSTETGNLRARIDGALSPNWSAGAEAFLGLTRDKGEAVRQDLRLQASAAHRAGPRDPITLLQAELRQRDQAGVDGLTAISSLYRSQYLSQAAVLNLRLGAKYDQAQMSGGSVSDWLGLVGTEYRHDLTDQLDFGLHGAVMQAARSGRTQHSFGLSLGLTPFENGWLALGYNLVGFRDPDFAVLGQTDKGAFVQFRLKFDADSLRGMFR